MLLTRAAACRALAAGAATITLVPIAPRLAEAAPATVMDLCSAQSDLSTWCAVVKTAGAEDLLAGAGPVTVFAPSNAAFAKLPADRRDALARDPAAAKAFVLALIVRDRLRIDDGSGGTISSGSVDTAGGSKLNFGLDDGATTVNGARLVRRDLTAGNGLLDVTDSPAAT